MKRHERPENVEQMFEKLLEAWKQKDFDQGKHLLSHICEYMPLAELERLLLKDLESAMGMFQLFVETDLDDAPDGSPAKMFYFRIIDYLIKNGPPEIKQIFRKAFDRFFPNIQPVGFNENGEKLFSLDDLATALGTTRAELVGEAEKIPGVALMQFEGPRDKETIH